MKQLIVPIAIIVTLIAFFVIIDRKEFKRYDVVQTVSVPETKHVTNVKPMAETNPAERKSIVETMPVAETKTVTEVKPEIEATPKTDAKPTETKPTTEAKSATEASPITEAKPAETKPADTKPAAVPVATAEEANRANEDALKLLPKEGKKAPSKGAKSVAEIKTENKLVPMAVPVLTPEEAIRANKEAIRFQRNKENAKAFQSFIHKIGLNNNRIHFILSLLPLLFVFDVLLFKRKKQRNSKMLEYISLPRRVRILFSVSLLAFGILVFVPWSVYFGNSLQFPFIFQDFVNWNLRVLTISIVGVSIILLLIPPIVSDYLVAIIAGLGLCVYVQAMFMNQHLGTMDGIEPIWSEHRVFGTINLIVWISIVLSAIVLRKLVPSYYSKVISMATGVVLFLEIIATTSVIFSASQDVWIRPIDKYFIDGSKQFQLSKEKNIVVFVMDNLASGYLEQCFAEHPETMTIVKDFIWYTDARSNYHMTFPGLIHEITGTFLPAPANNYLDLLYKTWNSPSAESFYRQMKDVGYDSRLFFTVSKFAIGPEDYFQNYFSNVEPRDITYIIDYKRIHFCLKQMSEFSFVPYFLKKYFFYAYDFSDNTVLKQVNDIPSDKKWIPRSNSDFLRKMCSNGITSDANNPVLSFHYMFGAHTPWNCDEKCNNREEPFDNPIPTTRGCFYILSEFIRLLKEKNIYDNTTILVCSDHGANSHGGGDGKYDMTFMIKPFHSNQTELSMDETKVQSIDILPTLLYIACGENADFKDFEGFAPHNIPNNRIRYVYKFYINKNLPAVDPALDKCYPGVQGIEEYVFNDINTFKLGQNSESFVRIIPFVTSIPDKQ